MSSKTRVFVIDKEKDIGWIKKNYCIRDNEEIFFYANDSFLQKLIDKMNAERDKKIFFIRVRELVEPLKKVGFIEEKDFFNHFEAFPQRLFTPQSLYQVINAM